MITIITLIITTTILTTKLTIITITTERLPDVQQLRPQVGIVQRAKVINPRRSLHEESKDHGHMVTDSIDLAQYVVVSSWREGAGGSSIVAAGHRWQRVVHMTEITMMTTITTTATIITKIRQ